MREFPNKIRGLVLGLLMLPLAVEMNLAGQTTTPPPQTFSATVYLDYRAFLSNEGPITLKPSDPASSYINNQFVFRRAYFNYENKINDNLKFRFRLDADNTANVTGVSLTGSPVSGVTLSKDDKLRPFLKHLCFELSNFLLPGQTLTVGMEETLTFKLAEDRWGYRSVAKTLLDGYKDITGVDIRATSADIGASLKGSIVKQLRYGVQVVNGSGYSHIETDQYKKFEGYLHLLPVAGISLFGYMDYERLQTKSNPLALTAPKAYTYKADAYFEMVKNLVLGGEWFVYKNDLNQYTAPGAGSAEKYNVSGWSVFARTTLIPNKLNAYARYDDYTPNDRYVSATSGLDKARDVSLVILGLDWAPLHSSLKLQPNVWITSYKEGVQYKASATSDTDIQFNLTFALSF